MKDDEGNIQFDLDCYVDADFAGLWPHEDKQDPTCVKSRTGYVLSVANCPIVWKSTLQSSIALSTSESEYNALSTAMREVLPLKDLVETIQFSIGISEDRPIIIKTKVWEDNDACRTLAGWEPGRSTSRTKHYAIKLHWFRSHIWPQNKNSRIKVRRVSSILQKADLMTKGLPKPQFENLRKLSCGW